MKNHVLGQATTATVAPIIHLGTYRRNTMAVLPHHSQEDWSNRQQVVYLLQLRATLTQAIAAHDWAVASRAALALSAPTYYLKHIAEGWDLNKQGSRLNTAAVLLGFADLTEACPQLPMAVALQPALGDPSEVYYSQAC